MLWYEGNIAEAITLSRKNGSVFVVYIEGNDDESTKLTRSIDQEDVSKLLGSNHFRSIKIQANTVPHQQFSEIYKGANVPSIYFIGKNGAPLDIVEKINNSTELLDKIENILVKAGVNITKSPAAASSSLIAQEQSSSIVSENVASELPAEQSEAGTSKTSSVTDENIAETSLTTDEKVEKAKQIIEQKREAKRKEEEEKEKMKEIERRKMGQDVQKMKRWQHDQELKLLMEAREKKSQDKVDRAARFSTAPSQSSQPSPQATTPPPIHRVATGITRIQFKLPDGSTHTHEFKSEDTLQDLKLYIKTNLNPAYNFMLATTFPKREFTNEHDSSTLAELELIPSAVLLILPVSNGTVSTNSRTFTSFLWSLLAPLLSIFSFLKTKIFGAPKPAEQPTSPVDSNKRPADATGETMSFEKSFEPQYSNNVENQRDSDKNMTDDIEAQDEEDGNQNRIPFILCQCDLSVMGFITHYRQITNAVAAPSRPKRRFTDYEMKKSLTLTELEIVLYVPQGDEEPFVESESEYEPDDTSSGEEEEYVDNISTLDNTESNTDEENHVDDISVG
ncbi:ubx domain-containing protein 4 [Holotrichia oblita]|uniref:Ubx domain-containing protein 4 n=1 Tax=Holotrichia oblita TaxID=644536 RepID=A0ACB9TJP0_HOLOL|nr:ubx domain-containing protein 4 [Holotrichia oblita]